MLHPLITQVSKDIQMTMDVLLQLALPLMLGPALTRPWRVLLRTP